VFGGRRKQNEEPINVRVRKIECSRGVQRKLVVKKNYVARKRDWCSKMTQVTNRKVLEREEEEREEEENRKDAEQFSMPYGGTSNWRIDTEERNIVL
jgi:hypothetical protein